MHIHHKLWKQHPIPICLFLTLFFSSLLSLSLFTPPPPSPEVMPLWFESVLKVVHCSTQAYGADINSSLNQVQALQENCIHFIPQFHN